MKILKMLDDCGDTSDISNWVEGGDGLDPADETTIVKQGSHSAKLGVDADLSAAAFGWWTNSQARGDWSQYQNDWLYAWVYIPTLDYLATTERAVSIAWGVDSNNLARTDVKKAQLSIGWNLLKCDFNNPNYTIGTIDWLNIAHLEFVIAEIADNVNDFEICLDSIMLVGRKKILDNILHDILNV